MERERIESVRRLSILDSPPDGAYDNAAELVATACQVPIAVVSIVDEDRIWFKARYGLEASEVPREPGLCASACLGEDLYEVVDARLDPRALDNSLVRGELGLQFYAAAPLKTSEGYGLGAVAVADYEPRELSDAQRSMLRLVATSITADLRHRISTLQSLREMGVIEEIERRAAQFEEEVCVCAWTQRVLHEDQWIGFSDFLLERFGVNVTHTISPEGESIFLEDS